MKRCMARFLHLRVDENFEENATLRATILAIQQLLGASWSSMEMHDLRVEKEVSIVAGATCGGRRLADQRRLQEAAKVDYVIQFPESLGAEAVLQAATQSKAALESISLVEVSSILQEEAQKIPSLSSLTVSVTGQTLQLITADVEMYANVTEEDNETNVTVPPLSCLTTPNMIVHGSNLTVQLAEDLGRFTVELSKVMDHGTGSRWLHLAYGWQQGGLLSTLWLNGTSVSLPFTSTMTSTSTTQTQTMEMNDTSDAGSEGLSSVAMANESGLSAASIEDIIWKAREEGWIVLPDVPNVSSTLEDDMDLSPLYFGWPLPSTDFDVAMANDGWRTLFRLYGRSLDPSGQWKVSDGTAAKPVVCVPQQDFCTLPAVTNGYVYNVTEQGTMGSVVELHCQDGFQDSRLQLGQRTALCSDVGRFQVGISRVSRDLIRATNLVQDVLDELEVYWAMDTRQSDTNWRALMQFEYRWRTKLRQGLEGLPDGSAVQEVLFQVPNYDGVTDKWLAMYTIEDVRNLKRMLEQKQLEMLDLVDLQQGQQSPQPLLDCDRTPAWCPLPPLPPNSQFATVNAAPVALGETITMECHPHYVTDLGIQELMCGNSMNGSSQWLASDGSTAVPPLTCTLNRSWCPALPSFTNAAVVAMEPLDRAVHSEVRLACRRGFRPNGGHAFGRCSLNGAWCSMADATSSCMEPPDWLRCELIPAYCPEWPGHGHSVPYNSSSAPKVIPVIDPLAHVFLREVRQLPLPSGVLGDIVTLACPEEFVRSSGDTRFKCGHGLHGGGQWQREAAMLPQYTDNSTPDAILHLVDEAAAEPLVCELETMKGVRRNYFDRLPGLFRNHTDRTGYDVVPYINQFHSPYDAAQFESYLRPKLEGNYTFSLEVVGSFVLTWGNKIFLAGRSSGLEPEIFNSTALDLSAGTFYFFHLEYWADPILPERMDQEMLTFPRRLRFLWSGPAGEMQPVPFTELYHTFDEVYGYPITARSINDPNPCDSVTQVVTVGLAEGDNGTIQEGLAEGDNGTIQEGTIGFDYNENLKCEWRLEAIGNVRYTIFSNFFDLVNTSNCAGDRLEFYVAAGTTERYLGKVCGYYPKGTALIHVVSRSIVLKFITDDTGEREGFNISWSITNQAVTLSSNPIVSGQIV